MLRQVMSLGFLVVTMVSVPSCGSDSDPTGPPVKPPPGPPVPAQAVVTQLRTAWGSTCATSVANGIFCWGENSLGEFGIGTRVDSSEPTLGPSSAGIVALGEVNYASRLCGLDAEGVGYCWGSNQQGEIGDGTTENSSFPVPILTDERFTTLTTSIGSTCGTTADGRGFCWGNSYGPVPVEMPTSISFARVTAGFQVRCGLDDGGLAYCWGAGEYLGQGPAADTTEVPTKVSDMRFQTLQTAFSLTCGLSVDGEVWCWGGRHRDFPWPELVSAPGESFLDIALDDGEICMVAENRSSVRCYHTFFDRWQTFDGIEDIAEFQPRSLCARTTDGAVWCWYPWDLQDPYRVSIPVPA